MHMGIRMYGYLFGLSPVVYWSMRFYEETWHPPVIVDNVLQPMLKYKEQEDICK